jgi:CRP-like cAMP-binding protein
MDFSLKNILMFSQLSEADLAGVTGALVERAIPAGQVLFKQGDPGDELIIVKAGSIAIYAPLEGDAARGQPIRVFQPGELLGEMALIDQKPRSLSARAETESVILTLNGASFKRLLADNPEVGLSVMGGLSERIRYTTDFLSEVRTWVRKIAEGSYHTRAIVDESSKYQDKTISALAAEFAQMASKVQEREDTLRKEVAQLRIEIDESRRKKESSEIMGTEYYQSLKEKVKKLRQSSEGGG